MAFKITDRCINCGYCRAECPNEAIYEPGMKWSMAEGTSIEGTVNLKDGKKVKAGQLLDPLSENYYYIAAEKCAECEGIHDKPQCLAVCPDPDAIIVHPEYNETGDMLLEKQVRLNLTLSPS